jgi:hypothetical protein
MHGYESDYHEWKNIMPGNGRATDWVVESVTVTGATVVRPIFNNLSIILDINLLFHTRLERNLEGKRILTKWPG